MGRFVRQPVAGWFVVSIGQIPGIVYKMRWNHSILCAGFFAQYFWPWSCFEAAPLPIIKKAILLDAPERRFSGPLRTRTLLLLWFCRFCYDCWLVLGWRPRNTPHLQITILDLYFPFIWDDQELKAFFDFFLKADERCTQCPISAEYWTKCFSRSQSRCGGSGSV